jgi:hypothetical protein
MSIIILATCPAPIEISFEGCSQSYRMIFILPTVEGKYFGTVWQTRGIIILQTHKYNLHYLSMHSYQCSGPRDFLLLEVLNRGDVIKIHKPISPIGNITFNLTVIKVINYGHNHNLKIEESGRES